MIKKLNTALLVLLFCVVLLVEFGIIFFAESKKDEPAPEVNTNFSTLNDKWYNYIEYQGYDDKLEKHVYIVHWIEEKGGVRHLNSKAFVTELQPTDAILYIEQHVDEFK